MTGSPSGLPVTSRGTPEMALRKHCRTTCSSSRRRCSASIRWRWASWGASSTSGGMIGV